MLSLTIANRGRDYPVEGHASGYRAETLPIAARRQSGNDAVERPYMALAGDALHRRREERSEQLLTGAVIAAGLPEQLLAVALRPSIEQGLIAEHDQALDELGALAFPSIELDRERKHRAEPFGLSDVHLAIDSARKSIRAAEFSRCNV